MLHLVEKQVYKLELSAKWRIYVIFHVSLLECDIIKKGRKFSMPEFDKDDNKEYKVEAIQDSTVYVKEADVYLLGLYYLVVWKGYPKKKNI